MEQDSPERNLLFIKVKTSSFFQFNCNVFGPICFTLANPAPDLFIKTASSRFFPPSPFFTPWRLRRASALNFAPYLETRRKSRVRDEIFKIFGKALLVGPVIETRN